jgi:hypothetical protein
MPKTVAVNGACTGAKRLRAAIGDRGNRVGLGAMSQWRTSSIGVPNVGAAVTDSTFEYHEAVCAAFFRSMRGTKTVIAPCCREDSKVGRRT